MTYLKSFWTGGLDSTFNVLYSVIVEQKPLQPYYIIDPSRGSWEKELLVMQNIRKALEQNFPDAAQRLLPTKVYHRKSIRKNFIIRWYYRKLTKIMHLGAQYEWLARFARQHHIDAIDLCFIKNPDEHKLELESLMRPQTHGTGHECRIRENPDFPGLKLFKRFRFPVYHLSKQEIIEQASQFGFAHLMGLTWFCHCPDENGNRCGQCKPCTIAQNSGYLNQLVPQP